MNNPDALQLDWALHALHRQCITRLLHHHNIHTGQPPLLFALRESGVCNQNELAKTLNVSPASIAVSLKRMERSGYICRQTDPADQRSNIIGLTEAGLAASRRADEVIRLVTLHQLKGFSHAEKKQLAGFYERMKENLAEYKNELEEKEESI